MVSNYLSNEVVLSLSEYHDLLKNKVIGTDDIIFSCMLPLQDLNQEHKIKLKLKSLPLSFLEIDDSING